MTGPLVVVARVSSVIPLTLLALGLVFVGMVAVVWPTADRQAVVDRFGSAIKELSMAIAGNPTIPSVDAGL